MYTIYKYPLAIADTQILELPAGSRIVNVAAVNDKLCLYAYVNTDIPAMIGRTIVIHGTGHEVTNPESKTYIGTVVMDPFVWHVFEVKQ